MDHIRAPWRHAYIASAGKAPGCVICAALETAADPDSLVVHVATSCFVVMNLYPYNSGHVMISPKRHIASLSQAEPGELEEMMTLARRFEGILSEVYTPDGMNIGMNLGRAAGAGVADHIHLHMVPRWLGDANFISVLGETRVIAEDALQACRRLRACLEPR